MERLTDETQIGLFASLKDKAEAVPGAFGTYDCLYAHMVAVTRLKEYEDTGLTPEEVAEYQHLCETYAEAGLDAKFVQFCIDAMQNGLSLEGLYELAQAEKDGRLVVLPCKDDIVYTIKEDYFNCGECRHRDSAYYQAEINRVSCDMENGLHCPLYIEEHKVSGFEVSFDTSGAIILSNPGEFGYEGLEQFSGVDGKVYYTREEAEAALKKGEEADNEAD